MNLTTAAHTVAYVLGTASEHLFSLPVARRKKEGVKETDRETDKNVKSAEDIDKHGTNKSLMLFLKTAELICIIIL